MSFPKIPNTNNNIKHRKELDSSLANQFNYTHPTTTERASIFTSRGSMTLEAAIVAPIFFFAVLSLVYLLEMMAIQTTVHHALHSVGKEIAQAAYSSPIISSYGIEQHLVKNIGAGKLEKSMIVGGATGLNCSKSQSDWNTAVIDLSVQYDLEIPILMFRIPILSKEDTLRVKGWTGYASGYQGQQHKEVVYVTDYGLVYHQDMSCTYLELAIRTVSAEQITDLRNQSGGKYTACGYCKGRAEETAVFYVTDYGEKYHTSLDCSRIKRNIYAVPLEEVYALGGCSKCVK